MQSRKVCFVCCCPKNKLNKMNLPVAASEVSDLSSSLDMLFETFSVISEGSHIFLCDLKKNYSRWSDNAVQYFGLPGIYMYNAGEIWKNNIHPDDREGYSRSIEAIFSGTAESHDMMYR